MNSPAGHHSQTPTGSFRVDRSKLFERNGIKRGKPFSGSSSNTASEAANIQKSLQRTQALLKNELERVSQVASAIDDDGKILEETMTDQQTLNVSSAKKALTSLQRAQQREQRVLMASIVFFYGVVFYILWCRLLIRIPFADRLLGLMQF
jgi:hypothetical protein